MSATPFHHCADNAIEAVKRSGSHYFDAETMRYFGSRTYELYEGPGGAFLVMSNRDRGYWSDLAGEWLGAYGCRRYYFVTEIIVTEADTRCSCGRSEAWHDGTPGRHEYAPQVWPRVAEIGTDTVDAAMPFLEGESGSRGFWTLNAARKLARRLAEGEVMPHD